MVLRIEDYALIGDTETAALVGTDGSIDWLCLPRFDSAACFARLVGGPENGFWRIAPTSPVTATRRRYRESTLVLETEFETADGVLRLIDFMPPRDGLPDVMRIVEVVSGSVEVRIELRPRFGYGAQRPWIRERRGQVEMIAGPDGLHLETSTDCSFERDDHTMTARFVMATGERRSFRLGWFASHEVPERGLGCQESLAHTETWWRDWIGTAGQVGPWTDVVRRSLITLKALTYSPTGAIVAAPTTSLPERIGGGRNWDYRYCWLRDAAFTLGVFLRCGFRSEAADFRDWVLRAIAGDPHQVQIMYGIAGERWLAERELPWLSGYENSRPVRIGNGAFDQFQLDIVGEVLEVGQLAWKTRPQPDDRPMPEAWAQIRALLDYLEGVWRRPDRGIWEVRGPERHFVHSKVMAWVAFDRAVWYVENLGVDGPVDTWRGLAREIHDEVCREGFDTTRNTFVQYYGGRPLDASLLLVGSTGFLPWDDPRVVGTIEAVERELVEDGFVYRYQASDTGVIDGLAGDEGAFLPCTLWLVECLAHIGRLDDARRTFDRVLGILNDVQLVAEEYEPRLGRQIGNFPQAFTHVFLVHAALKLHELSGGRGG